MLSSSNVLVAQSYAPAAGQPGSTAIHYDSSAIVSWATTCVVNRGFMNIENESLGYVTFGTESNAIGPAVGSTTTVISLGDGGTATLSFASTIINGPGADFVVFENGVTDGFLELGFVEVSSDGQNFVRFPAISEIETGTQVGGFGVVDCRYIHNFAGKYRVGYGTPFDLEDLTDSTGIDLNAITHVRIVDVIGSINPTFATYDSQGTIVNNLHPTPFESGGFDLEGIGVINAGILSLEKPELSIAVYPNPVQSKLLIVSQEQGLFTVSNTMGELIFEGTLFIGKNEVSVAYLPVGVYLIKTSNGSTLKFIKR